MQTPLFTVQINQAHSLHNQITRTELYYTSAFLWFFTPTNGNMLKQSRNIGYVYRTIGRKEIARIHALRPSNGARAILLTESSIFFSRSLDLVERGRVWSRIYWKKKISLFSCNVLGRSKFIACAFWTQCSVYLCVTFAYTL